MKTVHYVGHGVKHYPANNRRMFSTQYMGGNLQSENLSRKRVIEESVKMGGFEVSFKDAKTKPYETQQPMAGHSEFWIG